MTAAGVAETVVAAHGEADDLHTVVLFGSAAHGALRDGGEMASDVDVAVAGVGPLSIDRRLDLASRLSLALHREVDLDRNVRSRALPGASAARGAPRTDRPVYSRRTAKQGVTVNHDIIEPKLESLARCISRVAADQSAQRGEGRCG